MRHGWIVPVLKRFVRDFEEDPHVQIRIHKAAIAFWAANFALALIGMVLFSGIWAQVSIGYLALISIYSNFATDYDALSASQASLHAIEARDLHTETVQKGPE